MVAPLIRWLQSSVPQAWGQKWRPLLMCVLLAHVMAAALLGLRTYGALQSLELKSYDLAFTLGSPQAPDPRITLIGLSESDIAALGYPLSDQKLRDALATLREAQALVVGVDIYRDHPVNPGHQALNQLLKDTPNIIWVSKMSNPQQRIPPPHVLAGSEQVGFNDMVNDVGGVIRRGLLFMDDGQQSFTAFPLQLALRYFAAHGVALGADPVRPEWIRLGAQSLPAFESNDGPYAHADAAGYQFLLRYQRLHQALPRYSVQDLLAGRIPAAQLTGKIVLLGVTADSVNDVFMTPVGDGQLGDVPMYGLELHAHIVSQLLRFGLGEDQPTQILNKTWENTWIWLWTLLGGIAGYAARGRLRASLAGLGLVLVLLGLWAWAWFSHLWLPVVPPLLGYGFAGGLSGLFMARDLRKKNQFVRNVFGRYLSDDIVNELLEAPDGLKLGGQSLLATVMFTDLRGFSAISEKLSPETVVDMLNIYLKEMTRVVFQHGGSINEFMGDGILIVFGIPHPRPDDAARALRCAVDMQLAMAAVNAHNQRLGLPDLAMGIGLHTGHIVAGNVGSDMRAKYAVVGSHVNLASRVESLTIGGQVLASAATLAAAPDVALILNERAVPFKGFAEPVTVYEIGGIAGHPPVRLPVQTFDCPPLATPLPVHFEVVDGKHMGNEIEQGLLLALGEKGTRLHTELPLAVYSSVRLAFQLGETAISIYGKVLAPAQDHAYTLYFTSPSETLRACLHAMNQPPHHAQ